MARNLNFSSEAYKQHEEWREQDPEVFAKLKELIYEAARDPFKGRGKPELLKHKNLQGCWSRRITKEHRLIYKVNDDELTIFSCKGHY